MGKSIRQKTTDDGLPVFQNESTDTTTDAGLPILKKKESLNFSPNSPSDTFPTQTKQEQPVNTSVSELNPEQTKKYDNWKQGLTEDQRNEKDYDLKGFFKKNGPVKLTGGQHLNDEFKMPNHMTFSDESKYSTSDKKGGKWIQEGKKWNFYASDFNLTQHSEEELKDYFKKYEPNSQLILPKKSESLTNNDFKDHITGELPKDEKEYAERVNSFVSNPNITQTSGDKDTILEQAAQRAGNKYYVTAEGKAQLEKKKKTFQENFKNHSLTAEDMSLFTEGAPDIKDWNGMDLEQMADAINNKSKNIDKWQNAPTQKDISNTVSQLNEIRKKKDEIEDKRTMSSGARFGIDISDSEKQQLSNLEQQEVYAKSSIQKAYNREKDKLVPDIVEGIKGHLFGNSDWESVYENPNAHLNETDLQRAIDHAVSPTGRKSPLQWNPETHRLTPESDKWIRVYVDKELNAKKNNIVNAQVSGDVNDKNRTYQDISDDVVRYLNTVVPVQSAQKKYTDDFLAKNPKLKDVLAAQEEQAKYFSKENSDTAISYATTWRDKEYMKAQQKYFSNNGILNRNQDYTGISHKYAQLVHDGKMTEEIAKKQIDTELKQHPSLKAIVDNYQNDVKSVNDRTSQVYENYLINGLKKVDSKLTVYKDGDIGIQGITQEEYAGLLKKYQEGLDKVRNTLLDNQQKAYMDEANKKAKGHSFMRSLGASIGGLQSGVSKYIFNKTGWGGDKVRYFESQEMSSPQATQSDEAKRWNWKGVESLTNPDFWLSGVANNVPVLAGGAAISAATDGAGLPEYVSWLANAGLFTAQSGISAYNNLMSSTDTYGNRLTEADASHYMAKDMKDNFVPNLLMTALTSGALSRVKNIAKPSIGVTIGKGVLSGAEAQPFFTWQGYNSYANMLQAQGKKADFWDYMQSDDFKDNLVNGMVVGGGLGLLHTPGTYLKQMKNWTNLIHSSEGEFRANSLYNVAMQHEMNGSGNYFRDAAKLHIFNEAYGSPAEKADLENMLQYSVALDRNVQGANLDPKNVHELYQAHNLALADLHDEMSEKNATNKNLSKIYADKAKEYREEAKSASDGTAKYHYLKDDMGNPIFLSDNSFKVLDKSGKIAEWMKSGVIEDVVSTDDPEFGKKYKENALKEEVQAKPPVKPEITTEEQGSIIKTLQDNKDDLKGLVGTSVKSLIDNPGNHKDIVEGIISQGIDNPEVLKGMVGEEAYKVLDPIINKYKDNASEIRENKGELPQVGKADERVQKDSSGNIQQKQETGTKAGDKEQQIAPEDHMPVSEMMGKPGLYKDQRGSFVQDGQSVIFKVKDSNREYELGNVNEIGGRSVKDFGIEPEESVVKTLPSGNLEVRGKEYVNKYSDPLAAVNYDKEGNIVSVNLETPEGQKRTFRGNVAEDLAYQLHLKQISDNNEQPELEQFINSDEQSRNEIENGRPSETSEAGSNKDSEQVQRQKIEPISPISISSPKIETDEKEQQSSGKKGSTESKSEGQEQQAPPNDEKGSTDNVNPSEGADAGKNKPKSASSINEPPKTPEERPVKESPKEEFTAVRKEKNAEIKGAKELFDKQKTIKWTETYNNALSNVQAMYPNQNLYDAMRSRVDHFTAQLDSGILFNPTSEDIAVFNVFKDQTKRKIAELPGWDSKDDIQRMAALAQFNSLQDDLFKVVRVTNPGGEAGRAFNLLQSEIAQDSEHGLQIRRMELLQSKGGGKLSEADLDFTASQWEKERAIMQKESEAREKVMQERFDKQISDIKKRYEKVTSKEETPKTKRDKLLSQKGKDLADKIRGGKFKKGDTLVTFPGLPQAVNFVLDKVADLVEGGFTLAEAIDNFVKEHKVKDKDKFTKDLFSVFNKYEKREDSYDKIEKMSKTEGLTDINHSMVGKNLIQDYVNSHVGLHDPEKVLGIATKELKKILPDVDSDRLREAYLKEGEFRQPTKKELEDNFKSREQVFKRLTQLDKDISDLKEKGEVNVRSGKSENEINKEIEKKEKELKKTLNEMGLKVTPTDKYSKASYEQRAKMHNDRIDDLSKELQDRIEKGSLPSKEESNLLKLKNQLDAVKIKLNERNKLGQEKVLDGGLQLLKAVKSEFARESDAVKSADINRSLQKIIDKFGSDKDDSEQDIKLKRAKDQASNEINEYKRKINAGEYEDRKPVTLTKSDAELIRLENERTALRQKFDDRKKEYEKKNKSNFERVANFGRSLLVDYMIMSPITLLKVAGSAGLRPQFEAATKLTFGKGFEKLPFATTKAITERAKLGGESNSIASIKRGYEAYLRQYTPEKIHKLIQESSDKYTESSRAYNQFKDESESIKNEKGQQSAEYKEAEKKLDGLKNTMNDDLVNAVGYGVYNYLNGSSLKEAFNVLMHRTAMIERQFGQFTQEEYNKNENFYSLDNLDYMADFIGRSHAALKNFSGRFSFATGFMARLEGAVRNGVDVANVDKIMEIANESYLDFEKGKYQESNWISDAWSKATSAIENIGKNGDKINMVGKGLAYLMRSDVAITRVPVNMLREGIVEYTAGAIVGSVKAAREYYKAKNIVLNDGWTDQKSEEFKTVLRDQLQKIDPKQAATIMRAFRKGGFGMGLYALGLIGHVAFGGFPHKGQKAEDKKKKEREEDTGIHELATGEIKIGNWEVPETASKILEHTPAFQPLLFGLGVSQVYKNNVDNGEMPAQAVMNDIMAHIDHIVSSIPQIDKVALPLAKGAIDNINLKKKLGEWDDVDINGNPMIRKVFRPSDYINILPGRKKELLSEDAYKDATSVINDYKSRISDVMRDANLSDKDKKEQRDQLIKEREEAIDQIYEKNKKGE